MLNFDKYREELKKLDHEDFLCGVHNFIAGEKCKGIGGTNEFERFVKCTCCARKSMQWMIDEYEPPMLENGDELKPGDLIMVLNEEKQRWEKRKFLAFFRDSFYCISSIRGSMDWHSCRDLSGEFTCYKQARLPEEGE